MLKKKNGRMLSDLTLRIFLCRSLFGSSLLATWSDAPWLGHCERSRKTCVSNEPKRYSIVGRFNSIKRTESCTIKNLKLLQESVLNGIYRQHVNGEAWSVQRRTRWQQIVHFFYWFRWTMRGILRILKTPSHSTRSWALTLADKLL